MALKLCGETITVFNGRVDPDVGGDVWKPTVIRGVGWYATEASTVDASKGGLVAANKCVIRIPTDADAGGSTYAAPLTYANAEDVSGLWTLKGGDIVVKGEATGDNWTPAKLKKTFPECVTVLGVTDNRRAPNAPHWRVTAT